MRHSIVHTFVSALVLLSVQIGDVAYAGSINVEFSGQFNHLSCLPCTGTNPFSALLGTPFSGSIVIPDSEGPAISTNLVIDPNILVDQGASGSRAEYHFASADAYFELHTSIPEFDLEGLATPSVFIQNCSSGTCFGRDDFMWIMVSTPGYLYTLSTTLIGGIGTIGIPSLLQLQNSETLTGLQIATRNLAADIVAVPEIPPAPTVEFTQATSVVPISGVQQLFLAMTVFLGLGFQRKVA